MSPHGLPHEPTGSHEKAQRPQDPGRQEPTSDAGLPPIHPSPTGTLWIVATPLGNLSDLSSRAADVLARADLIAAEDTRRVAKLLSHLGTAAPVISFHAHSGPRRLQELVEALQQGKAVALVTDAGTPGIADPGPELVDAAWRAGATVRAVPGPCAAVLALSASGFPASHFEFAGYPPRSAAERRRFLAEILSSTWPTVLYEAPGRVASLLDTLAFLAPDRQVLVAREMTKLHEELLRGSAADVAHRWRDAEHRGEVTIVIAGGPARPARRQAEPRELAEWLAGEGLSAARIASALTHLCGLPRPQAYELASLARRAAMRRAPDEEA